MPWQAFVAGARGTFYRPIVTLSFAADYLLYGLRPIGYAITNLVLLIACASTIAAVCRELRVSMFAAIAAAAIWLLNPHGINMSVLWLSGRTTLLMTLLSCGGIFYVLRGRHVAAAALLFAAMLSKEDAVLVPIIALACLWAARASSRRLWITSALCVIAVTAYTLLRVHSQALTPASAPSFYRLTSDVRVVADNAVGYMDRAGTAYGVMLVLAAFVYGAIPGVTEPRRRLLAAGLVWFAAGLAITVRVPVRSSLYAVFPAAGVGLIFATLLDGLRERASRRGADIGMVTILALLVTATPIYRSRNARWVIASDVSRETMRAIAEERGRLPSTGLVTFEDEPVRFANFADALGDAATDAVRLALDRRFDARIVPRDDRSTADVEVARFALKSGRVMRTK
jgi:hypothetical protein